jgi:hypothetical protein
VTVQGYRDEDVWVTGPAEGLQVVTAGVQKMAPGLKVAVSATPVGDGRGEAKSVAQQ